MRRNIVFLGWMVIAALATPSGSQAEKIGLVDGLWVMKKVEDRYEGDDVQEDMHLTLERTRVSGREAKTLDVRWLKKDYGTDDKLVIHFVSPRFAEGITLLTVIKPYKDDDRWFYFPEANLIRRIRARDEHSSFMGTDFTYFDLSEREPDEEVHNLLRIEKLDEIMCYLVETLPKESSGDGYSKKLSWVDKDRLVKLRIQYFNRAGQFQKQYDAARWEKISDIWTPTRLVMEDFLRGHRTTIERSRVRYNQGIPDAFFETTSVDRLVYREGAFSLLPFSERPTAAWAADGAE